MYKSNCQVIMYNGDIIQEISYRGSLCYSLMRMYIVYEDGSPCALVDFNSLKCRTWDVLVNMFPDLFCISFSAHEQRYKVEVQKSRLLEAPNGMHYALERDGRGVFIEDAIVFDSPHSTTYTLVLRSSNVTHGGGSN